MKKVTLKRVLDVLTPTNCKVPGEKTNCYTENKDPNLFGIYKIARNGFPFEPTCIGYDPVQSLFAIGTLAGCVRILGKTGTDIHLHHESITPVTQLIFLVNEGALISVCSDDSMHLWNLRQKQPAILHSIKFNRERLTFCCIPYQSKWIYTGTERGNVYVCDVETFSLSGYCINWNKAIDIMQRSHPGQVVCIEENPADEGKIGIAYSSGLLIVWNLKTSQVVNRFSSDSAITSLSWNSYGKEIISSHANGMLCIWNCRQKDLPKQKLFPHENSKLDAEPCHSLNQIDKVEWTSNQSQNDFFIFSGGLPKAHGMPLVPSITILQGKAVTVLEMDYPVVEFIAMSGTPWKCDFKQPFALAILLEQELVVVDLETLGFPCVEVPHSMDVHDSPVTCLKMYHDECSDFLQMFSSFTTSDVEYPDNKWPLQGGDLQTDDTEVNSNVVITGHVDGSLRFWSTQTGYLKCMYKLRTQKLFVRNDSDDSFEITNFVLDAKRKVLVVSNFVGVVVYYFNLHQHGKKIVGLHLCDLQEVECGFVGTVMNSPHNVSHSEEHVAQKQSMILQDELSHTAKERQQHLRLKSWQPLQNPGFQAGLVCLYHKTALKKTNMLLDINSNNNLDLNLRQETMEPKSPNKVKTENKSTSWELIKQDNNKERAEVITELPLGKFCRKNNNDNSTEVTHDGGGETSSNFTELYVDMKEVSFLKFFSSGIDSATQFCLWIGNDVGTLCQVFVHTCKKHGKDGLLFSTGAKFQIGDPVVFCDFLSSTWSVMSRNSKMGVLNQSRTNATTSHELQTTSCKYVVGCSEKLIKLFEVSTGICLQNYAIDQLYGVSLQFYLETTFHGTYIFLFTTKGIIIVLSIPTLSIVFVSSPIINENCSTSLFCFAPLSNFIFMCSPFEVERIILFSEYHKQMQDNTCQLFIPKESPERAQSGFFQTIFGNSYLTLDRDELFRTEKSEITLKGTATKYTPLNSGLSEMNMDSSQLLSKDLRRLHLNALERGQKLGELEDKTHQMQISAGKLSSNAHDIMLKFKNKKWYQL